MRFVFLLLTLLFVLPVASSAGAQLMTAREHERMVDSGRMSLTGDVNTFFGRAAEAGYTFVQPTLVAGVRYREAVLEGALPFAFVHENNEPGKDYRRLMLGNPWLALNYLPDCSCGLSRLTLGMAYDAAQSDSPIEQQLLALARGAVGDWDGYLWIDHMLPLVAGASTRMELGRIARLSWEGDVIFGLPAGSRRFEIGTQHAGELTLVFNWHWQLAGRISAAYYPTLPGDALQSALSFYLRYVNQHGALGARFVMNLDPPAGFAFSRPGMWGLGLFYSTALF